MDLIKVTLETLNLLKMVVPVMFIGLLASNVFFSLPQVRRFIEPIDRLTSFANLRCGSVILAFFAHPIAGLSMLSDLYRRNVLNRDEVTVIFLISLIPRNIRIILMFLAPIAFSALGFILGLIYTLLEIFSRLGVILVGVLFGRRLVGDGCTIDDDHFEDVTIKESVIRSIKLFFRTLAIFIPSVFIVMLILDLGFLNVLSSVCKPVLDIFGLPSSGLIIIAAGTSSMIAGIGVAGSLLARGAIDYFSVLVSIFIASMFHGIVECLRRSLAINVSFFGTKLGVKLTMINVAVREGACIVALILLTIVHKLGIV